jgi:hypothetical protein
VDDVGGHPPEREIDRGHAGAGGVDVAGDHDDWCLRGDVSEVVDCLEREVAAATGGIADDEWILGGSVSDTVTVRERHLRFGRGDEFGGEVLTELVAGGTVDLVHRAEETSRRVGARDGHVCHRVDEQPERAA